MAGRAGGDADGPPRRDLVRPVRPLVMRAEAPARTAGYSCPACRGPVDGDSCGSCGLSFPTVAGLRDFRLESDRYLDLVAERSKAERLARDCRVDRPRRRGPRLLRDHPRRRPAPVRTLSGAHPRRPRAGAGRSPTISTTMGRSSRWDAGPEGSSSPRRRRGLVITAVDIAARWLVVARRRLDDHGLSVPLAAASAERLPWPDGTFATVVADSVIEHCDDPVRALREWRRVLRPGGRLVLWSPNRLAPIVDPHVRLWGVGLLPRPWAAAYSRLRRRGAWVPRTLSSRGVAALARRAGFEDISVGPAPIPRTWAMGQDGRRRWAMLAYERLRGFGPTRSLLGVFGPIWALEARAPSRPSTSHGDPTNPPHAPPEPSRHRAWVAPAVTSGAEPPRIRATTRSRLALCLGAEVVAGLVGFGARSTWRDDSGPVASPRWRSPWRSPPGSSSLSAGDSTRSSSARPPGGHGSSGG